MNNVLNIICVDDEKIVLDSLNAQLIRNFGNAYNYEFAESAEEALEIIEDLAESDNDMIVVIISDWLMPGMKGDELLEKAREKVINVKTILLTGHVKPGLIEEIERKTNGQIHTIFKPWNEENLIRLIKGEE